MSSSIKRRLAKLLISVSTFGISALAHANSMYCDQVPSSLLIKSIRTTPSSGVQFEMDFRGSYAYAICETDQYRSVYIRHHRPLATAKLEASATIQNLQPKDLAFTPLWEWGIEQISEEALASLGLTREPLTYIFYVTGYTDQRRANYWHKWQVLLGDGPKGYLVHSTGRQGGGEPDVFEKHELLIRR